VDRTPAQALIDEVVAIALGPALRGAGYRKERRTFRRAAPECIQVVNVQVSAWGSRTSQKFTVNLGVFFPRAQEALAGYSPIRLGRAGPTEYQCHLRRRLGQLMPQQRDVWWSIEAGEESSTVSREVGEAITTFGLPWLDTMSKFDAARREVENYSQVTALGFDLASGDILRARQRLRGLVEANPDMSELRAWGRGKGLIEGPDG